MSEFLILPVSAAAFHMRWKQVEPMLDKAMPVALRRFESNDILQLLIQNPNITQGWFIMKGGELMAVAVTQVVQFPRRRCLTAFAMSGKGISEWFEHINQVWEEYAKLTGCDHFECQGRRGWEKILDLEPRSTFLIKELNFKTEENTPNTEALMN